MNPIIYQNLDRTVTLIDIPTSIAAAQGTKSHPAHAALLSAAPLKTPYAMPHPQSGAANKNLNSQSSCNDENLHEKYRPEIIAALEEIKEAVEGDWCLPRKLPATPYEMPAWDEDKSLKRKAGVSIDENEDEIPPWLLKALVGDHPYNYSFKQRRKPVGREDRPFHEHAREEAYDPLFHNREKRPITLSITTGIDKKGEHHDFCIPPQATFLLADCKKPDTFRASIRQMHRDFGHPKKFDLIIMDPPWPNSSARQKKTYATAASSSQLDRMMSAMDVDIIIAPNGYVAVWITNAPRVRDMVLGAGGFFEQWNVTLAEEWIWLKSTVGGEPMFDLDSNWRKPYEVLLVGRAPAYMHKVEPVPAEGEEVKRRVLVGVSDLHSRKPCVKLLLEHLMGKEEGEYTALEIFARYCVAGWWAWGDQSVKYNWERYWVEEQMPLPSVLS